MKLKRETDYGFSANSFGEELEEDECLRLKEHTYRLYDYEIDWESEEESEEFFVGKCSVREMQVSAVSPNTMCYWADEDSTSFLNGLEEYREKNEDDMECLSKIVFISELEIDEKYRNKGYGTKFLQSIMDDLEDWNTLYLLEACPICRDEEKREEYIKKNITKLRRFYRNLGYKQIGRKSAYMIQHRG